MDIQNISENNISDNNTLENNFLENNFLENNFLDENITEKQIIKKISNLYKEQNYRHAFALCKQHKLLKLYEFLSNNLKVECKKTLDKITNSDVDTFIKACQIKSQLSALKKDSLRGSAVKKLLKVKVLCNWTSTENLTRLWVKMSQDNKGRWLLHNEFGIELTTGDPDYWVIINAPPDDEKYDDRRTIVLQMEPHMARGGWGQWSVPDTTQFLGVYTHSTSYNNIEWHLSATYTDLINYPIIKSDSFSLTTILSDKYTDPGHILRVEFAKYIDNEWNTNSKLFNFLVYGDNSINFSNKMGPLPYHNKDMSLFPFKYHFNAENNSIPNYFTEKLIDCILSETLCFYWGCPNVAEFIDPRAYVQLDLYDFKNSLRLIEFSMMNNEWEKRIDIIRQEKLNILNNMQFFPRLTTFLKSTHQK